MANYGTLAGTGALTPKHANGSGTFDSSTRPTSTVATTWLTEISRTLDAILSTEGFSVPVTDADVTPILDLFVNQETAAMVEGVNGYGRFGPAAKPTGGQKGRFALLLDDVRAFVEGFKLGMERMGATRSKSIMSEVAYRDADEAGDDTFPLFQRKSYGGETFSDNDTL